MSKKIIVKKLAEVTTEAVEKATGNSWDEWIEFLDKADADKMPHSKITEILRSENISYWWQQKIASGYRLTKGLRGKGQSANMFQAGVSKIFPLDHEKAWDFMTSPEITEIWNRGNRNQNEINQFKPPSLLRLPYQMANWKKKAVLQIRTLSKENKTSVHLLLTGLENEAQRNRMKRHLKNLIEQLFEIVQGKK